MRAVFERELRAFFRGRLAWMMCSILLLLNGALMTYFHFYLGNTRYEILLGTMMLMLCALLPLWIVPRMNRLEDSEEEQFLNSLPLSAEEIFFGKFLAAFVVLLGFTLVLGLFPLVLYFVGATQMVSAYAGLLAAFLLGCAVLSILVFVAVLCRKRLVAWLISYGVIVLLFVLSNLSQLFPGFLAEVVSYLSLFDALSAFAYSLFTWRVLLWYLFVGLLFFGATLFVLAKRNQQKFGKKEILSGILAAVLLVASLATAFLPAYMTSVDMTSEGAMRVSTTTKKYLRGMDEDVTIYLLTDDMSETPYKNDRFEAFLDRYVSYSDRLTLERIPVSESGTLLAEFGAEPKADLAYYLIVKSGIRQTIISYGDMLYYMHSNDSLGYLIPKEFSYTEYETYLTALYQSAQSDSTYTEYYYAFLEEVKLHFVGETLLNQTIEYVVRDLIPQPYVLTGHGEPDLNGILLGRLMSGYRALDLSKLEKIPADAASLTMLAPTSDYTQKEIGMLSEYLDNGGLLTILTDEKNLDMPNLMGLLNAYGLSAEKGAVRVEVEQTTKDENGEEKTETVLKDSVPVNVNSEHILATIPSMGIKDGDILIEGGNSIAFHKTSDSSLITTALLTTTDRAFVGDSGKKNSYVLGAAAETNSGAKIVWFTGARSYLLTEKDITENSSQSVIYPLFCPYLAAQWTDFTYTSNLPTLPGVVYEEPYLRATDTHMIIFGILAIAVIPLAIFARGMIGYYKRKKA